MGHQNRVIGIILLIFVLGVSLYIYRLGWSGIGLSLEGLKFRDLLPPGFLRLATTTPTAPQVYVTPPPQPAIPPPVQTFQTPTSSKASSTEYQIRPEEIPAGFTREQLSPYFKKIRLGSVSRAFGSGPEAYEQISFYYGDYNAKTKINVSNWQLRSNRGSQTIGRAVEIYDPSGLAPESDIYLSPGETLNIYSSVSAIGLNLRLNKCIGYLENHNHFIPSLPRNCPYLNRSEITNFTGQCQNYILSLNSCQEPVANPPIPADDDACRQFLDAFNYRGCFDRYRTDKDFLNREWRAWTNNRILDNFHDRVLLFDQKGLLVDEYQY